MRSKTFFAKLKSFCFRNFDLASTLVETFEYVKGFLEGYKKVFFNFKTCLILGLFFSLICSILFCVSFSKYGSSIFWIFLLFSKIGFFTGILVLRILLIFSFFLDISIFPLLFIEFFSSDEFSLIGFFLGKLLDCKSLLFSILFRIFLFIFIVIIFFWGK